MKNKLTDLNNHLFAQLERLSEEDLSAEKLEQEVMRADAIVAISEQIIDTANTALKGASLIAQHGDKMRSLLPAIDNRPPVEVKPAIQAPPQ